MPFAVLSTVVYVLLTVLALINVFSPCCADEAIVIGKTELDVRMRFQGKDLVLSFAPTHGDAMYMARKFCHQRMAEVDGDIVKECIRKVGDFLIQEVEKHQQREAIQQKAKTNFEQSIDPGELSAEADVPTHTGFSLDEHRKFASPTRSTEISQYYQTLGRGKLKITLDILGKRYFAEYDTTKDTPIIAARRFCNIHIKELGISKETFDSCSLPVEKHFRTIERDFQTKDHLESNKYSNDDILTLDQIDVDPTLKFSGLQKFAQNRKFVKESSTNNNEDVKSLSDQMEVAESLIKVYIAPCQEWLKLSNLFLNR